MHTPETQLARTVAAARGVPPDELQRLSVGGGWRRTMRLFWCRWRTPWQRRS